MLANLAKQGNLCTIPTAIQIEYRKSRAEKDRVYNQNRMISQKAGLIAHAYKLPNQ